MSNINRFGILAIQKGFITKEQLLEALAIQIDMGLKGTEAKLIGLILYDLGYMNEEQIQKTIKSMHAPGS